MNLTYYLGAGASYNSVPLVQNFIVGLQRYSEFMLSSASFIGIDTNKVKEYCSEISKLCNDASKHASIDTYARKLHLKNDKKAFVRLKNVICHYLIFKQAPKEYFSINMNI